jgi:hypothetical protein
MVMMMMMMTTIAGCFIREVSETGSEADNQC